MINNSRENGESRKFGALCLILRKTSLGIDVLLFDDFTKNEMTAGLKKFYPEKRRIKSVPGGGRGVVNLKNTNNGKNLTRQETLIETIKNEVLEEAGLELSDDQIKNGITQISPFVVAQKKSGGIDQVAVTSKVIWFDSLSYDQKKQLSQKIGEDNASWTHMGGLAFDYKLLMEYSDIIFNTQFRTLAYIVSYIMFNSLSGWTDEAILIEVNRMNEITNNILKKLPGDQKLIRNTAFDDFGKILTPDKLPLEDAAFLYAITN